jgi:hypothetical protein
VILLGSNLAQSHALEGSSCKRNGATTIREGAKFICTKVGKKFVWRGTKKIASTKPIIPAKPQIAEPNKKLEMLTLTASIEQNSTLRLELVEDVYLGHCLSFLVYDWGLADSYEGVFYRQKKEFLVPINLEVEDDLPRSFTFECQGYPVQSHAFNWSGAGQQRTVSLRKLVSAVAAAEITNVLPASSQALVPGTISAGIPDLKRTRQSIVRLPDGRNAHETSITYRSSIPRDICSAKLVNKMGESVPIEKPGPSYFQSNSTLIRSGFDRLHSFGLVSYRGYKEEVLKLEINCSGAGTYSEEFLHPAPPMEFSVIEDGPCSEDNLGKVFPSLKSQQIELTCSKNAEGNFVWVQEKSKTAPSSTAEQLPQKSSGVKDPALSAQLNAIINLGLKARKIGENLLVLRSKIPNSIANQESLIRIDELRSLADQTYLLSQSARTLTTRQEATTLASRIVKEHDFLSTQYEEIQELSK